MSGIAQGKELLLVRSQLHGNDILKMDFLQRFPASAAAQNGALMLII